MKSKILVIEDNLVNNELLKTALEFKGFHVTQAFDGKQGMHYLQHDFFHVAIVDLQLPFVHGTEIIEYLVAQPVHPEIIVYSSSLDDHPPFTNVFAACEKPTPLWKFIGICQKAAEKALNTMLLPPPPSII